jgi:ankyrin repeat protein
VTQSVLLWFGYKKHLHALQEMAPLLLAVKEGHWAVAEKLLQSHAPLEQCDPVGHSPLMLAASEGHVGLIELLLDKGEL